ncbi:ABC transporter permease [Spirochaetia bacterium]|nr:ABC transporter permease [Spirochaetia bacterium]
MSTMRSAKAALSFTAKLLIGLLIVSPVVFGTLMSFMSPGEFVAIPPHLVPLEPIITNYINVSHSFPIFRFVFNSFLVCAIVVVGQIITCSFAAYGFSFYNFKGRGILFLVVLSTMMIPGDVTIIANFLTIMKLRINDTYLGLVLPYMTSAMGIFLVRQFFLTIPKELHEAAIIDGCRDLRFLLTIVIPISKPAMASLGIYTFIGVYNQFFWPLLVTNSDWMRTVQVGIFFLVNAENGLDLGIIMAGFVITLMPAIIAFIIGQKQLVKGMTAGAIKG